MQMELKPNNIFMPTRCELCGLMYGPSSVEAVLYDDEGTELGFLCNRCIEAGKNGLKNWIREVIQFREREVERLNLFLNMDFDLEGFPTVEEFDEAKRQVNLQRKK